MSRVHEAAVVSAIAEAQRDAAAAHEAWAEAEAEAGWAAGRAGLFAAGGGGGGGPAAVGATAAAGLPLAAPIPRSPAGGAALPPRARAYVGVVAHLNEAAAAAGGGSAAPSTDAVAAFADAAAAAAADAAAAAGAPGGPPPDPAAAGIAELWAILRRQAEEVAAAAAKGGGRGGGGAPMPAAAAVAALAGSRAHLEAQFAAFMDSTIRSHRAVAALGGAPGREGRLRAYIRVREPEAAPFDFDVTSPDGLSGGGGGAVSGSGSDTTWHRVWLALRAGWVGEAATAADGAPDAVLPCGTPLSAAIREWGRAVAAPSAPAQPPPSQAPPPVSALVAEAERLLRSADRSAWARSSFRHRAAVHALLAGDARCVRAVLAGAPGLCGAVEDWVWFQAAAAGRATAAAAAAGAGAPPLPPGAATLASLQASAARPGPAHYGGRAGGAPWRFAAILLLTVQPRGGIAFAARHPAARGPLRGEAPHLALAAAAAGVWGAGGEGDCGSPAWVGTADGGPPPPSGGPPPSAASEPAPLLRSAGRALARPEPAAALEYYVAAARLGSSGASASSASSLALRAALLRELLTESGAVGGLLGTGGGGGGVGGVGGPLARFAPGPADRAALVRAVAAACEAGGQTDWAAELYAFGGAPGAALRLICGALAGVVEGAASGGPGSDASAAADRLVRRGNAAAEAIALSGGGAGGAGGGGGGGGGGGEAAAALDLFSSLKAVRALLAASRAGDPGGVLRAADALPFLPSDAFRLQRCVDAAAALPEPLAERLSAVVPAVARAAADAGDPGRVRVLATFAGSLPQRVSRAAFDACVRLHDRLQ